MVFLVENEFDVPMAPGHRNLLDHISKVMKFRFGDHLWPIRLVITNTESDRYHCEVGALGGKDSCGFEAPDSVMRFVRREIERTDKFNAVLLVPTGIGAEIGGHAGDAMPVARLMAEACDTLITHPNVVNASDINEMPESSVYVEGSVISRLLMGTVGLQKVRKNRVIVVIDAHEDQMFVSAAVNAVSAARACYGFDCPRVVQLDPPVQMMARFTESGRAGGEVQNMEYLCQILSEYREDYDAVAIASVIDVPEEYHREYFDRQGEMVNPWGGVEAMLTHAISSIFNIPSAHSPMFETQDIANWDPGVVDPRMAAEAISLTFLQCVFKGLQRSPKIIINESAMRDPNVLTAADISCVVIPDGCLGLPTLAALEQGIPVIAVKENKNLMRNDLKKLPWAPGQLQRVENYWEAIGVMCALRAGIEPKSVRRPLEVTAVETRSRDFDAQTEGDSDQSSGTR